MTVDGAVKPIRRGEIEVGVGDRAAHGHRAVAVEIDREMFELPVDRGFDQADIDAPALPRHPAPHQQRENPLCRSEEHTSVLQSLMRISYAVFCLKKTHTYIV